MASSIKNNKAAQQISAKLPNNSFALFPVNPATAAEKAYAVNLTPAGGLAPKKTV